MEVEELFKYMLNLFDNISSNLHNEYDKLSEIDMQLSDLDHYIEIHSLKSYELAKIGKLRKTLREKRRQIKNNIDAIETTKKFTDKYNAKLITGDIIKKLKEHEELKNKQENPVYKYRTNIIEVLNNEYKQ